ncbi:MAG: hypothetical protein ACUVWO_02540 [Thermodesulfobacteriota bacterium]
MFVRNYLSLFLMLAILGSCLLSFPADAKEHSSPSTLLDHAGKSFSGIQDPAYIEYDLALRKIVADRIHKRFGIALDPKSYSGFDLLNIEALFKCKKSEEPFDLFLRRIPQ